MTVTYRDKRRADRPLQPVAQDMSAPPWVSRRHRLIGGPASIAYGLAGTVDLGRVRLLEENKLLCRCPVCRRLALAKLSRPAVVDGDLVTVGQDIRCPCPACGFVWQFRDGAIVYRDGDAPWL